MASITSLLTLAYSVTPNLHHFTDVLRSFALGHWRAFPLNNEMARLRFPKILESCRREFRVTHCVLDVLVAEIRLQRPRVVPLVGLARSRRRDAACGGGP